MTSPPHPTRAPPPPVSLDRLARSRPAVEVAALNGCRAARGGAGGARGQRLAELSRQLLARGLKMAGAIGSAAGEADRAGCGCLSPPAAAAVEAVAADWMLEFACYCLCRHFREECAAEFRWWRDVAQGKGRWRLAQF